VYKTNLQQSAIRPNLGKVEEKGSGFFARTSIEKEVSLLIAQLNIDTAERDDAVDTFGKDLAYKIIGQFQWGTGNDNQVAISEPDFIRWGRIFA
jgi:hypothetical protein